MYIELIKVIQLLIWVKKLFSPVQIGLFDYISTIYNILLHLKEDDWVGIGQ